MPEYITELQVSWNQEDEESFSKEGFSKIPVNLNQEAGGNIIYLWYKKGMGPGISTIQFSFSQEMTRGLLEARYTKIDKNLNEGAGGDKIYLWYSKSDRNVPIVDIDATEDAKTEAQKFKDWERLACDLNRTAGGNLIYLFVKREKPTYISGIKATIDRSGDGDNFNNGYIRVDENTNRGAKVEGSPAPTIFLWYRLSTYPKDAFRDLKVSTNQSEYEKYKKEGYLLVNQDLNEGTRGNNVYLWYMKDNSKNPIKAVTVITNQEAVGPYQNARVNVIQESLNTGNNGVPIYVCFQ
ncbi:uncharacterized protein LOC118453656 [Neolamprologus brichardi]|uniref:uncharacterized protein LOC118453656 n=1 Tax=Neolamprologus brichardi TaxID=32507 RepID=UPI0016437DE5|nr:uncharacterized protein LOC118453656 [Neolamprologus brichardi]